MLDGLSSQWHEAFFPALKGETEAAGSQTLAALPHAFARRRQTAF